jgi:hypothetical protein
MSRRSKGPRLWLRNAQYGRDRKLTHVAVWIIKDGKYRESTGCGANDRRRAEAALARYIGRKHLADAEAGLRPLAQIPVADVIALYGRDIAPKHSRPRETAQRIAALLGFFGDKVLSDVNGALCRAYVGHRGSIAAARRELEELRAAINHHRKEGLCSAIVEVALPEAAPARGGPPCILSKISLQNFPDPDFGQPAEDRLTAGVLDWQEQPQPSQVAPGADGRGPYPAAATWAITVSKPWPMEAPPVMTSTAPEVSTAILTPSDGPSPLFSTNMAMPAPTSSPGARLRARSACSVSQDAAASTVSSRPI